MLKIFLETSKLLLDTMLTNSAKINNKTIAMSCNTVFNFPDLSAAITVPFAAAICLKAPIISSLPINTMANNTPQGLGIMLSAVNNITETLINLSAIG